MQQLNKPIRVAQVIGITGEGGVESVVMNYYTHMDHSRVQFDFFVESESKIINRERIESMGGKIVVIPSYKNLPKYISVLTRLFREGNYDIVHSNMNALSVFTLYAAKRAGIKIRIAHSHSTSNKAEWKRNLIKNILRPFSKVFATHYFACSELAGRWLFGDKTFDEHRVRIINNAIDLKRFRFNQEIRDRVRAQLGLKDEFVIGHIGRFMMQKNHGFLIDIFNAFQKIRPNSKLMLIGTGPLYQEIVNKVAGLGLMDKVIFVGATDKPEEYYQAMDCFCLPSLYEGLPVVGIEAQVNGLKCFLSDDMTKETKVLETTEFHKLSDGAQQWSEYTDKADVVNRENGYLVMTETKYNIVCEARKLEEYYGFLMR